MRSRPRRPPPAGLVHRVSQGENLESIAFLYGHFARSLWDDENNAALREKRPDPNVLHPGDEVFIPGLRERQESRPVDRKHRFRRKGVPSLVRVRALVRGRPLAEQPYTVEADGVRTSGVTDGGGLVECYVRPNARVALVHIGAEPLCWELRVSLRTLDPVTEYLAWCVELEAINEELVELEGKACAKERNKLLEFFEQQLEQAALARLPDADRQLQAIWSDFEQIRQVVEPLDACWTSALEILRAMKTLVTALWEGIDHGFSLPVDDHHLRPAPKMPVDVLEQIAGKVGDLLMPLSPEFNEQVGLARNHYQFWLTAALSPIQKRAAMDYAGGNGFVQAREKLIALNETVEQLPQLLSTLTKAAALRRRCDALVLSYANAGATTDNWRLRTLHSVRNALLVIEDARDNTADSLIDRTLKIIPPIQRRSPPRATPSHRRPLPSGHSRSSVGQ